ncbi:MAG: hypothetical protein AAFY28_09115 [Actinomycetota bacterium]
MRPEDLVFWLDHLGDTGTEHGVLCQRHADSMIVPRNWTLDDLREPDLHLFRPPDPSALPRPGVRRPRRVRRADQLSFDPPTGVPIVDANGPDAAGPRDVVRHEPASADISADIDDIDDESPPPADPWRPDFDVTDDLDGLLAAESPLLARAFRGTDRDR